MAGTNYNTQTKNPFVKTSLTNELGFATQVECAGDPNTNATDLNTYAVGCILRRTDVSSTSALYENQGTSTTPSWVALGSGGGGTPAGSDSWVQYNDAGSFGADANFFRSTDGSTFGVQSTIATGKNTAFIQSASVLGVPIDGIVAAYSDNGFLTSFTGMIAGDFTGTGGATNSLLVGYQPFASNASAVMNASYDVGTDKGMLNLRTGSTTNRTGINVSTTATTQVIEFDYGGSNSFKFPTTQPTAGTVMGYVSTRQLGWVTPTGSPIAIGNSVGGGTSGDVLFVDASTQLAQSSNFTFTAASNTFQVGTSFGTAIKSFDGGGMGNIVEIGDVPGTSNKTKFGVYDGSRIIRGITDFVFQIEDSSSPTAYLGFEVNNASTDRSVSIGDSQNLFGRTKIIVKDTGQLITLNNSGITKIGDADGAVNSTLVTVDDSVQAIKFTGAEYQNSTVEVDSSVSTTYTVLDSDRIIYVNTNTAGVTITLPSVSTYNKRLVKIKCSGTNGVTVVASVGSVDTGSLTTGQIGEWQALNSTITWQRVM